MSPPNGTASCPTLDPKTHQESATRTFSLALLLAGIEGIIDAILIGLSLIQLAIMAVMILGAIALFLLALDP